MKRQRVVAVFSTCRNLDYEVKYFRQSRFPNTGKDTKAFLHLVKSLLNADNRQRITAIDALSHSLRTRRAVRMLKELSTTIITAA